MKLLIKLFKRNKYNITQKEIENEIKEWEEYLKENKETELD